MRRFISINLKEKDIDSLFLEMKKFVDSWGEFDDLKTIEDKVYYDLFQSFFGKAKNGTTLNCSYPEAHAVYRILKIILQKESNDVFERFAKRKGLSIINNVWCYTESGQEFDFEAEEQPKKSKNEKLFLFFLKEFQSFLIK